jgi:hypothetical protein
MFGDFQRLHRMGLIACYYRLDQGFRVGAAGLEPATSAL